MQFVRQSKFRHVYVKPMKREFCLEDIRITKISWDSLFCAVNTKFIAIITEGAGGPFSVFPVNKAGRADKDYPIVDAHRAPCLDIAWCPFNENVIASCSEDCTAKVWHIPDAGLVRTLKEPIVELLGHQKRVSAIVWHPSASNVLLTAAADLKIFIWNVGTGEALIEIAGHPDLIWSVDFNYNGSKIVTTCKDRKIRIIDPRTGRILQQGFGHEGVKPQRAIFLKDGRIFSTGFTKRSERMYALREEETLEEPIIQEDLDTSNGILVPLFDPDTSLLYLVGKGDSNVRYYEINNEAPFVHFINIYSTPEPQRGIGFMPKRGLNINENEIARIYKVTNKGLVDILQFFVPRKSELFQEDLYPGTAAPTAAISAEEWINGKDADPVLMPLRGSRTAPGEIKAQGGVKKSNILAQMAPVGGAAADSGPVRRSLQTSSSGQHSPEPAEPRQPSPAANEAPARPETTSTVVMRKPRSEPKVDLTDSGIIDIRGAGGGGASNARSAGSFRSAPRDGALAVSHETTGQYGTPPTGRDQPQHRAVERDRESLHPQRGDFNSIRDNFERDQPVSGGVSPGSRSDRSVGAGGSSGRQASRDSMFSSREATPRQSFAGDSTTGNGLVRTTSGAEFNLEELLADVQKLKTVIRRHERRIRHLEEHLQERDMLDFENL